MTFFEKTRDNLPGWLANPYWAKYYNEAPSLICKDYIALQFLYSDTGDDNVAHEMDLLEPLLRLNDWKHLLSFSSCKPERGKIMQKIKELAGDDGMNICCTFLQADAQMAGENMEVEVVRNYGDDDYLFDDGYRRLHRCKKCGCYIFTQHSEFHGMDRDDYYTDYYPVATIEEGDWINEHYGVGKLEQEFPGRYLKKTNGKYCWSK